MLVFLLPTQLGLHFWPQFSYVRGLRIDYLSPVVYVTDLLIAVLFILWLLERRSALIGFTKKLQIASRALHSAGIKKTAAILFKSLSRRPMRALIFIIAFYLLIKSPFSPHPMLALYGLLKFLELVFFGYLIASSIRTKKHLTIIAVIFSASLIIQSLLAVFHYVNQGSLNNIFYFLGERKFNASTPGIANASVNGSLLLRPYATFPHPNVLAGFLLTGIVFIYTFLANRKNLFLMILKYIALTLGSIALMLTLSRVAIAIWILLIIYLVINLIRKQKPTRQKIGYLLPAILIIFIFLNVSGLPIFPRLMSSSVFEKSVTARQNLAETAYKAVLTSPLYGIGHYHFLPFRGATALSGEGYNSIQPVHNIFLLVLAENGLIGLFLFVYLFILTFRRLIKNKNPFKICLMLILIIIAVLGLFDHYWLTIQQGQLLLALFLGLSWAL